MKFEFLTPAMQHAEEADLRTEMLGIACHFQKGFCTGAKQEIVEDVLVLQHQGSQVTRTAFRFARYRPKSVAPCPTGIGRR